MNKKHWPAVVENLMPAFDGLPGVQGHEGMPGTPARQHGGDHVWRPAHLDGHRARACSFGKSAGKDGYPLGEVAITDRAPPVMNGDAVRMATGQVKNAGCDAV